LNRAVTVIAEKVAAGPGRGRKAATALKELGDHPDGGKLAVMDGRYGPYVKWEKINATLPNGTDPQDVSLEQAVELVNAKAATKGKKKKAPAKKKPAAKKKAPAKKATAKKAPAKKATAKKTAEE
jgi:DNA topoisomerase-1